MISEATLAECQAHEHDGDTLISELGRWSTGAGAQIKGKMHDGGQVTGDKCVRAGDVGALH